MTSDKKKGKSVVPLNITVKNEGGLPNQVTSYNLDGNMTFDGRTGMSLTWNDLGLVEIVSLNDTVLVNYS